MASLLPERVRYSLPFTYTGVDFAGPFIIKSSAVKNTDIINGYVAVFVGFSTKAVHLEVCSDLSADAFLAAYTRFTGRRGLPKQFSSLYNHMGGLCEAAVKTIKPHLEKLTIDLSFTFKQLSTLLYV